MVKSQPISYAEDWMPIQQRLLIKAMEALTGRGRLMRRYRAFQSASSPFRTPEVWDMAMDHLGCRGPSTEQIEIPRRRTNQGLLLIANHPFGVTDGVTLAWIASRLDPNFRVIANGVLRQEPSLNPNILPVEFQPVDTQLKSISRLDGKRFKYSNLEASLRFSLQVPSLGLSSVAHQLKMTLGNRWLGDS